MIFLILFLAIFTNVKARDVYSITLLLAVGLIAAIVQLTYGWDKIVIYFPLLRVHMNLAFFVMLPSILCFVCVVTIFGFDLLTYWYFSPERSASASLSVKDLKRSLHKTFSSNGTPLTRSFIESWDCGLLVSEQETLRSASARPGVKGIMR